MPYIRPDIDEVLLNFRLILKLGAPWGRGHGTSCPPAPPSRRLWWYQNMDEALINGIVFLDLKKHLIQLTMIYYLVNYIFMEWEVKPMIGLNCIYQIVFNIVNIRSTYYSIIIELATPLCDAGALLWPLSYGDSWQKQAWFMFI